MPRTIDTMQVDPIACVGHGICAELLPEWIRLDDWGYPIIRDGAIPPELMAQARVDGGQLPSPRPPHPQEGQRPVADGRYPLVPAGAAVCL